MADESKYPTRIAPYGLRIPPDLKARIEASARDGSRSLHSEIISVLEECFPPPQPRTPLRDELNAILNDLNEIDGGEQLAHAMFRLAVFRDELDEQIHETVQQMITAHERGEEPLVPLRDEDLPF